MSFSFVVAVTICSVLETKKIKSVTVCIFSPSTFHEVLGLDAVIFIFFNVALLSQLFHSPVSSFSKGALVPLCFLL